MERVARRAAALGLQPSEIVHSGKLRARETAEILAEHLRPSGGVRELAGLAPMDDPARTREALISALGPVMAVGHLPHLSRLTALLVTGDPTREIVAFRMGAIVCLDRQPEGWRVKWILTPELVP